MVGGEQTDAAKRLVCFSKDVLHIDLFRHPAARKDCWPQRDFGIDFWLERVDELTFRFFQLQTEWPGRAREGGDNFRGEVHAVTLIDC